MLYAFAIDDERLVPLPDGAEVPGAGGAAWVDLVDPSEEERDRVEAAYRQSLPEREEVEEIEASARFYEDEDGVHVHSLFLHETEGRYRNTSVAFTIAGERLFSLRDREIPAFRLIRMRARREGGLAQDAAALLISLLEVKVEGLAGVLETIYTNLEETGQRVLEDPDADLEDAIDELARQEDVNGKVRLCLMDTQRAVTYLLRRTRLSAECAERAREILRDIDSLIPHNNFLFEKVNFLMDTSQGFISIEQSKIIKIFSVVAVVFLPPTLIASIYGMNFRLMPELDWAAGYPMALLLMVLAGIAPYWYFKRKGWL